MLAKLVPVALPKMRVHMMLEQDPCELCRTMVLPDLLEQLDLLRYHRGQQPQLFTMLPFIQYSPWTFLERMTPLFGHGPIRLKDDLKLSEERYVCMVCGRCRGVRCHRHCQYSMPNNALARESYAAISSSCANIKCLVVESTDGLIENGCLRSTGELVTA